MIPDEAGIENASACAPSGCIDWNSRRLWSLWDMITADVATLVDLAKEIGRITTLSSDAVKGTHDKAIREANQKTMKDHEKTFKTLALEMSALQCSRIIAELGDHSRTYVGQQWQDGLKELQNRLYDECSLRHFLILDENEKQLFVPDVPLFGTEVEDKVPAVIEDISEAGKCLGLSRATSAVFHLMRVMEIGVQKFGDKLGVQLVDEKVWQTILDQLNAPIKKMGKSGQPHASIAAHLYNVKLAWRNETMHPKATYTLEEAQGIFAAVKNYMIELVKVL